MLAICNIPSNARLWKFDIEHHNAPIEPVVKSGGRVTRVCTYAGHIELEEQGESNELMESIKEERDTGGSDAEESGEEDQKIAKEQLEKKQLIDLRKYSRLVYTFRRNIGNSISETRSKAV